MTRAMCVSPSFTILDDPRSDVARMVRVTPEDTWSQGFGSMLDRIAALFDGEGVLILDEAAISLFKLPTHPGDEASDGLLSAQAAGWQHGRPSPWTVFYGEGRPRIVVGLSTWPEYERSPVVGPSPIDTVSRLSLWQELTGHAWRGSPGIAGMTVLRETLPRLVMKGARVLPSLKMLEGPDDGYELDWQPDDWSRPLIQQFAHGYDATRMYLAAAQSCELLAPWKLQHTGRVKFDLRAARAGWWRVALGPWNDARIPAPAGPGETTRWVTSPTLALLTQLREAGGAFQDYEIRDSWTAPGHRVLRRWAETLESTYRKARDLTEAPKFWIGADQDGAAVMAASKAAYRETIGLLKPNAGWDRPVYRADWHYSIIAQARATLWRKVWRVGLAEDRWPLEIHVDHVWYGSDEPDPETARPRGLARVNANGQLDALGTFKWKGSREKGRP